MSETDCLEFMRAAGRSARRTLEQVADDLGVQGKQREEMLKFGPITVMGPGFQDVYGEA